MVDGAAAMQHKADVRCGTAFCLLLWPGFTMDWGYAEDFRDSEEIYFPSI